MEKLPKGMDARNALKITLIESNLSHLSGQILTLVDASIEGDKNQAMKDLVKKFFADKMNWLRELAWLEQEEEGSGHMPAQDYENGLVPFDEDKQYSFKQV